MTRDTAAAPPMHVGRAAPARSGTARTTIEAILPAAGRGTRLGASVPKFMVPVDGRPVLAHLLERLEGLVARVHLVVSREGEPFAREWCSCSPVPLALYIQESPTGMADAVLSAAPLLEQPGGAPESVLVIWGDQVGLTRATIERTIDAHRSAVSPPLLTMPVLPTVDPYVHYERDATGNVTAVLQRREGDVMPPDGLADCGCFLGATAPLFETLRAARQAGQLTGRQTGEANFLPVIPLLARAGRVLTVGCATPRDAVGLNTPQDLERFGDPGQGLPRA